MKVVHTKNRISIQQRVADALSEPNHAVSYDPFESSRFSIKERVVWFWKLHHWRTVAFINLLSNRVYISEQDWSDYQEEVKAAVKVIETHHDSIKSLTVEVRP